MAAPVSFIRWFAGAWSRALMHMIRPPQHVPMASRIIRWAHMFDVHWHERKYDQKHDT